MSQTHTGKIYIPNQCHYTGDKRDDYDLDLEEYAETNQVETKTMNGVDGSTNAVLIYGINVIDVSSSSDFCARLPLTPIKGKTVTVINISNFKARIFPSVSGGKINGVVDGYFDVLPNSIAVNFVCYENPNPGSWSTSRINNLSIVIPDMSIVHVNGVSDNFVGVGSPVSSGIGAGVAGVPYHLVLTPDSAYWKSENAIAKGVKLKVYTNIVEDDCSANSGNNYIECGVYGGLMASPSVGTAGVRGTVRFWKTNGNEESLAVNGGALSSPPKIGDMGTMYFEKDITPFDIGVGGTYSRYYYTFLMHISATAISKTYTFRFELEYV